MNQIYCEVCGEYVDKVVLSFGTRTWDEARQAYVHRDDDEEGDWTCAGCGTPITETRFYPPSEKIGITGRPFPQTYGDWVNLAEDIKKRYPPDSTDVDETNFELGVIGGLEEGNIDESKRWLLEKAAELGIT